MSVISTTTDYQNNNFPDKYTSMHIWPVDQGGSYDRYGVLPPNTILIGANQDVHISNAVNANLPTAVNNNHIKSFLDGLSEGETTSTTETTTTSSGSYTPPRRFGKSREMHAVNTMLAVAAAATATLARRDPEPGDKAGTYTVTVPILNSWWSLSKTAQVSAHCCPPDQIGNASTLGLLMTQVTEMQTDLYNDLLKKQVASVGWLYALWLLGVNFGFQGEGSFAVIENSTFYWIYLALLVPIVAVTPLCRSYHFHGHFWKVLFPNLQWLLRGMEPQLREDGYQVTLFLDEGTWCPLEPTKLFLHFEPVQSTGAAAT